MPISAAATDRVDSLLMDIFGFLWQRFLLSLLALVLLAGLSDDIWTQSGSETPSASQPPQSQTQNQDETGANAHPTEAPRDNSTQSQKPGADNAGAGKTGEDKEVKITPQEADELFHSVDEIMQFDSKVTGLPIKHEVKRKLTSRDEVIAYLTKHMNDKDTQRLRRSELVLKKFGLVPRDFDLEKLLLALLREQVAGYYDPKTKTVNLLDWVPVDEQEPVMAHELTHALQDQSIGLEKWMDRGEKDLGEIRRNPTSADIENDETDDAREAVIEGQAEAVALDYALAPSGRSVVDSPDLVESMEAAMTNGTEDSPAFKSAPIVMRESLTFPYSWGAEFVIKLLEKGGKSEAFAAVLANPPHTTRQIMQPETYLAGEKIDPMPVPDFKKDFKNYQKFDIGAMGEFDVEVLVEQYVGKALSKRLYPEWRGGYYYATRPKTDATAPLGLLYVSRWSSAEKAGEFADVYARSLGLRYHKVQEETGSSENGAPEAASGSSAVGKGFKLDVLIGRHVFQTDEGPVVIEERGDMVFVSESLDAATTATVEKEVLGTGQ